MDKCVHVNQCAWVTNAELNQDSKTIRSKLTGGGSNRSFNWASLALRLPPLRSAFLRFLDALTSLIKVRLPPLSSPSDMMVGRVWAIQSALGAEGFCYASKQICGLFKTKIHESMKKMFFELRNM
ncbi:hypothetical protein L2E82_27318 [Cichorium intybus]|uniref:Uncharacterized protein n=1 Tax=Cichorium intybus TaxID=13427 RepID=A0ACB9CST3_CICIN|nr:hypothetical protein L2E82_27318 [Cichorium intybus]